MTIFFRILPTHDTWERKVYKVLVGNPEGKRPLRRPRHKWEDGMRMNLREIGWGVDWIRLAQDRDRWWAVASTVMNLQVLRHGVITQGIHCDHY
jgi:hypothetical protein